jgi:hypothetical protein
MLQLSTFDNILLPFLITLHRPLLNATTLQLEELAENEIPPYSMVSHAWGNAGDEVLFQYIEIAARAEQ